MSLILLVVLFFQLLSSAGAVYEARSLVLFKTVKRWNEARNVCAQANGHLATVDTYTISILLQASGKNDISMWDNIWIGLHSAHPTYNALSAKDFIWEDCQMLGDWSYWKANEPSDRYNNWCVRLEYNNLRWYPEQCTSQAHFLCQYDRGPCQDWRLGAECAMTSANLLSVSRTHQEEAACRDDCLNFQEKANLSLCWGFKFTVSTPECTLLIGENPVLCSVHTTTTYMAGTGVTWIRECFNVSSTTNIPTVTDNQDLFPSNHCNSLTSQRPETTSRLVEKTTVVTRTSGAPWTDFTSMKSTGTQPVANLSTRGETQAITNLPTTEGTQAVTNFPTTEGTQAVTNFPTTEGTQAVTNFPTTEGTQAVTTLPITEGTQSVTTLPTTVGVHVGQTSIAAVSSTESKIPGKESLSFLCICTFEQSSSISSKEQFDAQQKEIKKLALNKSSLSSWRRKRESAKDNRVSAQATGIVGVACLVAVVCLIVLFDFGSLWIKISDRASSIAST